MEPSPAWTRSFAVSVNEFVRARARSRPTLTLVAGQVNRIGVTLQAAEPILRAEFLRVELSTVAWADLGPRQGTHRVSQTLFRVCGQQGVAGGMLDEGAHSFFFDFDLPPSLPRATVGVGCEIAHVLSIRLEADWSVDPREEFHCDVVVPPRDTSGAVQVFRSPETFHHDLVVEAALIPSAVAGSVVSGTVALRGGAGALDAGLDVTLTRELLARCPRPLVQRSRECPR